MRSHRVAWIGGLVSVTLVASAVGLGQVRERHYPAPPAVSEDRLMLTSGQLLKRLTVGYNALAADLYWIRTIQYYGSTKLRLSAEAAAAPSTPDTRIMENRENRENTENTENRENRENREYREYGLLAPLLDLTTTLDPHFNIAYRFGAIFLAEPYPAGAGRPDLAIALLEKGLKARTDKWEYMQDIGYVHYWWRQDPKTAAVWFDRASRLPGAPWWLQSLAANTLTQGGDRQSSRLMWQSIRESAEIDWLRRDAERRLLQLQALDDIDALQRLLDDVSRRGVPIASGWQELVARRILPTVPADPTGTPYEIAADGRVRLAARSALLPLPSEPQRLMPPS